MRVTYIKQIFLFLKCITPFSIISGTTAKIPRMVPHSLQSPELPCILHLKILFNYISSIEIAQEIIHSNLPQPRQKTSHLFTISGYNKSQAIQPTHRIFELCAYQIFIEGPFPSKDQFGVIRNYMISTNHFFPQRDSANLILVRELYYPDYEDMSLFKLALRVFMYALKYPPSSTPSSEQFNNFPQAFMCSYCQLFRWRATNTSSDLKSIDMTNWRTIWAAITISFPTEDFLSFISRRHCLSTGPKLTLTKGLSAAQYVVLRCRDV